ncbi:hypothetical protein NPX13_g5353 [Xylaria arbuscula]|uniref:Uncharacterized protein n=1 Tax=Xylaria arbuscula TaxID=114810 RepID=A0A9W8TMS6_9PEZI|nr:hypothetical protein NPX13_g5353 [Xylaria arbuscula]
MELLREECLYYEPEIREVTSMDEVQWGIDRSGWRRCLLRHNPNHYSPTEEEKVEDSPREVRVTEKPGCDESDYSDSGDVRTAFEQPRMPRGRPHLTRWPTRRQGREELVEYRSIHYFRSTAVAERILRRSTRNVHNPRVDASDKETSVIVTGVSSPASPMKSPKNKKSQRTRWTSKISNTWKDIIDFYRDYLMMHHHWAGDDYQSSCSSSIIKEEDRGRKRTRSEHTSKEKEALFN